MYPLHAIESAVVRAVTAAVQDPEAVRAAIAAYRKETPASDGDARSELKALDAGLDRLRQDEAAAIQAQLAGMRAGASPDAYAALFADIVARRKDMENRRGELSRLIARPAASAEPSREDYARKALADTIKVLTAETLTGEEKHDAAKQLVDRVVCTKEGAEVVFMPGLFGESEVAEEGQESIVHTTCVVCKVRRRGGEVAHAVSIT